MLRKEGNSRIPFTIRHGGRSHRLVMTADPYNDRIKLKEFSGDSTLACAVLLRAASAFRFGKAIAMVQEQEKEGFIGTFREEGRIPGFFSGKDAVCLAAYTDTARSIPADRSTADEIVAVAREKAGSSSPAVRSPYPLRRAEVADSSALASFYRSIFQDSYPTPVSDPAYLARAIDGSSVFWLMEDGGRICGAASLETDMEHRNAEVTDCAVLPDYRGQGLLHSLVRHLEEDAREMGLYCLYSLSRALLPGINIVLSSAGYRWHGRLVNNCRICGGYEDMNIWQKFIRPDERIFDRGC